MAVADLAAGQDRLGERTDAIRGTSWCAKHIAQRALFGDASNLSCPAMSWGQTPAMARGDVASLDT